MRYVTLSIVVDGALELEEDYTDYALAEEEIRHHAEQAEEDGLKTEVYVVEHEHPPTEGECACVQYLTDHHPRWTFPGDPPPNFDEHPLA